MAKIFNVTADCMQFSITFSKLFLRGLAMNSLSDDHQFQSAIQRPELQV